jgi:dTMP kinase
MRKGHFFVLDGGEGSGKSTQMELLKERLPSLFPEEKFVFTREPGGSPFAQTIRNLILSDEAKEASGHTMIGLFIAARADHVEKIVLPALEAGNIVVCDRYLAATYAYQIVAQQHTELREMYKAHATHMPQPDLTLFLDIDPSVAEQRLLLRREEQNHFDIRGIEFHERVREGFREYTREFSQKETVFIDASKAIESVARDIIEHIASHIRAVESSYE